TFAACTDIISSALVDVPLTLVPNAHDCHVVLPGRTILEITSIQSVKDSSNSKNGVRVRMGPTLWKLNLRWPRVCETGEEIKYKLDCGAVVMDSSSSIIKRVQFIVRDMEFFQYVIAPLSC
ncbi:hypothetical protein PFISCL1PPCAC_27612, partial [Pristionchus fissidentatus]